MPQFIPGVQNILIRSSHRKRIVSHSAFVIMETESPLNNYPTYLKGSAALVTIQTTIKESELDYQSAKRSSKPTKVKSMLLTTDMALNLPSHFQKKRRV